MQKQIEYKSNLSTDMTVEHLFHMKMTFNMGVTRRCLSVGPMFSRTSTPTVGFIEFLIFMEFYLSFRCNKFVCSFLRTRDFLVLFENFFLMLKRHHCY